jgi:flagellar motor protein MotB
MVDRSAFRVVALLSLLGAVFVSGCGTPQVIAPPGDNVVIVLVSGTSNEPRPILTPTAIGILSAQADRSDVSSTVAVVVNADGDHRSVVPLTPRRTDRSIEHGFQRASLITANVGKVEAVVSGESASSPELDLLDAIDRNARAAPRGTLIVVSNGLSTAGGFDLREVQWNADPAEVVRDLAARDLLPALSGWHVVWTGINERWGEQPRLPKPARDANSRYWAAICAAAGASSCTFDQAPLAPTPPTATVRSFPVPVPHLESTSGPAGVTISVPETLLGFPPNSAVLGPAATDTISEISARIGAAAAGHPNTVLTVTGYAADPPGSVVADCVRLSNARARAVADALRAAGVRISINVVGGGIAPGTSSMRNGFFVEALAEQMRRVDVEVRTDQSG